ncbi:glycosyl hydrolase family 95 catalytic domain-containing protein [Maribellus sediminis]|uniref:glycosyl hydrolase family 95 catalytic domain-containing protein n=1 Tax=Maribellus sediminis TaxID=2696285 RepID=UPI001430809D|nr:glycoside hydrolase N-terminal domain-containing protein [Maribellus sediminis]
MKNKFLTILLVSFLSTTAIIARSQNMPSKQHNLVFDQLAEKWDEAVPLGNGMLGCLIWEKDGKLRMSLDRADLWDLRPKENINFDEWKFNDVYKYWKSGDYQTVHKEFDRPSNDYAAPTKIPAAALEFDVEKLGEVKQVTLDLATASSTVEWENGAILKTFIQADQSIGWYRFENIPEELTTELIAPDYQGEKEKEQGKQSLSQLGYPAGTIKNEANSITYQQKGWNEFTYEVHVEWQNKGKVLEGCWSISSQKNHNQISVPATELVLNERSKGFDQSFKQHLAWWKNYWAQSSITIPDPLLGKQYYLEMYKFGAAARENTPPISLQAVWTADNGQIPPWKGDFHHDLNTQLSYWPSYAGNQLQLEKGFVDWLWNNRDAFKKYTRDYFEVEGLNVPGVTTLDGEAMGGWIQYSMGQTVAAWLGHNFYQHWRYSMDREFLETRTYPWLKDVATFFENIAVTSESGGHKLRMSSSPEIYNNSAKAWFPETTNFDLALIRWTFAKARECALELGLNEEAEKWKKELELWPDYAIDPETGFMFAPDFPYDQSHRHFSHLMAFHPLGLVDISNGESDKTKIENTLKNLAEQGSSAWVGYSFSWQGNLYARAFDGEKAAEALRTFAECFCSKNSFHLNGDQCKAGHSNFTYRPFTLEGNFAFASGIQEMLLQSHTGVIRVFPALPADWKTASFTKLRANGAFVVSAELKDGRTDNVSITSEKGGILAIANPFKGDFKVNRKYSVKDDIIYINTKPGENIQLTQKN